MQISFDYVFLKGIRILLDYADTSGHSMECTDSFGDLNKKTEYNNNNKNDSNNERIILEHRPKTYAPLLQRSRFL